MDLQALQGCERDPAAAMGEEGTGRRVEGNEGKGAVGPATGTADGNQPRVIQKA